MLFLDLTRLQIETDDIHPGNFLVFDDNFANRRCLEEKMAAKRRAAVDGNVRRSDGPAVCPVHFDPVIFRCGQR